MAKKSVRRYEFAEYPGNENTLEWMRHVGNKYKLGGILLEGQGKGMLVLLPHSEMYDGAPYVTDLVAGGRHHLLLRTHAPTPEEWTEILRRSDDPLVYTESTGTGKPWIRKAQWVISGFVQQKVWVRDGLQCLFCGRKMGDIQLTIDHFVPLELGGANNTTNFVSACRRCNKDKGCIPPQEYCEKHGLDYAGLVDYLTGRAGLSEIEHLKEVS